MGVEAIRRSRVLSTIVVISTPSVAGRESNGAIFCSFLSGHLNHRAVGTTPAGVHRDCAVKGPRAPRLLDAWNLRAESLPGDSARRRNPAGVVGKPVGLESPLRPRK